jgi:hypothetical protein
MKGLWVPITIICTLIAIILFIKVEFEAAFVVAALGAVAWFLNYRGQVKDRLADPFEDEIVDDRPEPNEEHSAHDSFS